MRKFATQFRITMPILKDIFWYFSSLLGVYKQSSSPFQVCSRSDPELNTCLRSSIQNAMPILKEGIREFGIPVLEPMRYPSYTFVPLPPVLYRHVYTDIEMLGCLDAEIKDVDAHFEEASFFIVIVALLNKVRYDAHYEYFGRILDSVDSYTEGTCGYESRNTVEITLRGVTEEFIEVTDVKVNVVDVESIVFNYQSAQDPEVAKMLSKYLNDNWKAELGNEDHKYAMLYAEVFRNASNAIFSKIPFELLFPKEEPDQ
ncbi:uncharacterized protein LOC116162181 isoform X2 [Photinus pyralis]|uniref:uncharacterized protein LOC116162181 isoform X2 n=1 Tax=Photinus pyralis TaxID=7054 RepID=UPI001267398C|nr:uncharacterized protein LOC116162181 isoform X2 [Photinus pyralis]